MNAWLVGGGIVAVGLIAVYAINAQSSAVLLQQRAMADQQGGGTQFDVNNAINQAAGITNAIIGAINRGNQQTQTQSRATANSPLSDSTGSSASGWQTSTPSTAATTWNLWGTH